jgi:phosphoribosylamine--glycine ligase
MINILVVGNGGREHAIVWKLKQSHKVNNIFVAPGNAGISQFATNINISETKDIIDWLKKNPVDLVIIGPDKNLSDGIVDKIQKLEIPVFGPTKLASEIEWSKSFAKKFMKKEGIPTADYEIFNNIKKAKAYIKNKVFPLVIKVDGLALGKGVIIASSLLEAERALEEIMVDKIFGSAGDEVIIEEYLYGKEISVHAFCDGSNAVMFPTSQDHKRIFDNDKGKNTGGMGTIAPVPGITNKQIKEIKAKIVIPTLKALKKNGRLFKGILFPGIMITKNGPKVIEFNARFGDPETQSYMRILNTDLVDIIFACINGKLSNQKIKWSKNFICSVVCASSGYPGKYKKNKIIKGLNSINDKSVVVFHAGTKLKNNKILTNGGRVLAVSATGKNLKEAISKSYSAIKLIFFDGMQYRKVIGKKSSK